MGIKLYFILNPLSGGGKTAFIIKPLIKYLEINWPGNYKILETTAIGDAIQIARTFGNGRNELMVVVGGDGTINEVVNGLLSSYNQSTEPSKFAIINSGSGAGFAQSIAHPTDLEAQLELINDGESAPIDVGVFRYTNDQGVLEERYFINECQIGIGAAVVNKVGMKYKWLGGKIAFGFASVSQLVNYKGTNMKVRIDDDAPVLKNLIGVVVGNGRYTAGGMQLTPTATLNDGYLDVLNISEMGLINRLLTFGKVYSGDHVKTPFVTLKQGREIHIESDIPVGIEADGELLGKTPCSIRVKPKSIHVVSKFK